MLDLWLEWAVYSVPATRDLTTSNQIFYIPVFAFTARLFVAGGFLYPLSNRFCFLINNFIINLIKYTI
nr:MAG TPA: hypothetical protein [Caudoviricetes sp.]